MKYFFSFLKQSFLHYRTHYLRTAILIIMLFTFGGTIFPQENSSPMKVEKTEFIKNKKKITCNISYTEKSPLAGDFLVVLSLENKDEGEILFNFSNDTRQSVNTTTGQVLLTMSSGYKLTKGKVNILAVTFDLAEKMGSGYLYDLSQKEYTARIAIFDGGNDSSLQYAKIEKKNVRF